MAGPATGDDRTLIARVAAGDATAFEAVVGRYAPTVSRLVTRLLGWSNAADADDLVQEVFSRVWERAATFRAESSLATWITTVTLNACRTWRRRAWVRRLALGRLPTLRPTEAAAPADEPAERDEAAERVRAAVRQLRAVDREVIVLHYLEGHPPAAVAAALGLRVGAVEVRLHRARKRLRGLLSNESDGSDR